MHKLGYSFTQKQSRRVFAHFDRDGSGELSYEELMQQLQAEFAPEPEPESDAPKDWPCSWCSSRVP